MKTVGDLKNPLRKTITIEEDLKKKNIFIIDSILNAEPHRGLCEMLQLQARTNHLAQDIISV